MTSSDKQKELEALRERVGKATGPDREIDALVWLKCCPEAFDDQAFWSWRGMQPKGISDRALDDVKVGYARSRAPFFTASLDAALALVERVLPGWGWQIKRYGEDGEHEAYLWPPSEADHSRLHAECQHTTPALALLSALLSALIANGKEKTWWS
jgi:hypothetical protein